MAMNQAKANSAGQVEYLSRWVDRSNFRVFVYNGVDQKLAENYEQFQSLISSGLWFVSKEEAVPAFTTAVSTC